MSLAQGSTGRAGVAKATCLPPGRGRRGGWLLWHGGAGGGHAGAGRRPAGDAGELAEQAADLVHVLLVAGQVALAELLLGEVVLGVRLGEELLDGGGPGGRLRGRRGGVRRRRGGPGDPA